MPQPKTRHEVPRRLHYSDRERNNRPMPKKLPLPLGFSYSSAVPSPFIPPFYRRLPSFHLSFVIACLSFAIAFPPPFSSPYPHWQGLPPLATLPNTNCRSLRAQPPVLIVPTLHP